MEGKNNAWAQKHLKRAETFFKRIFFYSFFRNKSLKVFRTIFYFFVTIVFEILVALFILSYPLAVWLSPDVAEEEREKIIFLTNKFRADLGLPVLRENEKLNRAAYAKVRDMFLEQYFSHFAPDGRNLESFFKKASYDYSMAGENLAMGFSHPSEAVDAWIKSPGHYSNLADRNFEEIGVGLANDIFGDKKTFMIAQYFGRPTRATSTEKIFSKLVQKKESKTRVFVDTPAGQQETLIEVQAILPEKTKVALFSVSENRLPLAKLEGGNKSAGEITFPELEIFDSPVEINFIVKGGDREKSSLEEINIFRTKTSRLSQYFFLRYYGDQRISVIAGLGYFWVGVCLFFSFPFAFTEKRKRFRRIVVVSSLVALFIIFLKTNSRF